MVVSGAPQIENNHAHKVCDMALDMVDAIKGLKDPSTGTSTNFAIIITAKLWSLILRFSS